MKSFWQYEDASLVVERMGLRFNNPIGLAAGFDKNGAFLDSMSALGFGFVEAGTVTPKGQEGNEQPRLFRLPKDEALINRMGFNNDGVDQMVQNLANRKRKDIILGGNIGKNKVTANESAVNDYLYCFRKLIDHVDYFVVNVSSPNTPGLRSLQEKEPLNLLLSTLQRENETHSKQKPILLKIAPDLNLHQLDDVLSVVQDQKIAGLIATNTTLNRQGLRTNNEQLEGIGPGGLSGTPLTKMATAVIQHIRKNVKEDFTIIGVGGIMNAEDALEKLDAGANLVQIYTGLIYKGPVLLKQINKAIARKR
ncbi:UNVERIFIED_CONTAM: hypothetical protein GTU68_006952 [Idotea baltica]|nr:hypothetical protein [Idotea baltica]